MDENQKAALFADGISAIAANRAVVRLHALLAAKGVLSNADAEAMRHLHLHDFDSTFANMPNAVARTAVDDARSLLDQLWQAAVQVPLRGDGETP